MTFRAKVHAEARLAVAKGEAGDIARFGDLPVFKLLFPVRNAYAAEIEAMTEAEREEMINSYAAHFKQGGTVVLPAALFSDSARSEAGEKMLQSYFTMILEGVKRSGVEIRSPVVRIAEDKEGLIRGLLFSSERFRQNPEQVIQFEVQSETLIAERLQAINIPFAVALATSPDETALRNTAAFMIDPDEIRKFSEPDKLRYWSRLTEFLLFAASAGQEQVQSLLSQMGIASGPKGFPELSSEHLLSEELTRHLATSRAA